MISWKSDPSTKFSCLSDFYIQKSKMYIPRYKTMLLCNINMLYNYFLHVKKMIDTLEIKHKCVQDIHLESFDA